MLMSRSQDSSTPLIGNGRLLGSQIVTQQEPAEPKSVYQQKETSDDLYYKGEFGERDAVRAQYMSSLKRHRAKVNLLSNMSFQE